MNTKTEAPQSSLSQVFLDKQANTTIMISLTRILTGQIVDASGSVGAIIKDTGHNVTVRKYIRFTTGNLAGEEFLVVQVIDVDNFRIDAKINDSDLPNSETYDVFQAITPKTDSAGNFLTTGGSSTVVDFLDAESMIPTGANAIPASASSPLLVVASLAAAVTRIQIISDVGEFINLYQDAAGATLIAHLVLTPDEIVDVDLAAGSEVYIRNAKNAIIDDINSILSINFLG